MRDVRDRRHEGKGTLVVGTSGFSYRHWKDVFYPPGTPQSRWLEVYAEHFSAVELNVTFYRLPERDVFADWARRTPADFRFVVKGSRTITHYRRLRNAEGPFDALLSATTPLAEKLACFLWQLPPQAPANVDDLRRFCELLEKRGSGPGAPRHAFEFREPSWFSTEVLDVLRLHDMALVFADPPREREPRDISSDFGYLRFHHGRRADGGYEDSELEPYVGIASSTLEAGRDVLAFFNNDPGGWAPRNAATFRDMVDVRLSQPLDAVR